MEKQVGKTPEVFKKEKKQQKRKMKSSYIKKFILENNQSDILSPRIGRACFSVSCQAVWVMDTR